MKHRMNPFIRRVLFLFFFVSGFCSLVYQVVWTRLAFASFGITTPVLSVVLSVFMLGLAAGSWAGGRWIDPLAARTGVSPAVFYAGAELVIGLGAFVVPKLFAVGERLLLAAGQTNSLGYLSLSALALALAILPWCVCVGMTFPFMMAYVRERDSRNAESFSYLYLANVLGAMGGTILTAMFLVEIFGFHHSLLIAAAGNFAIAAAAVWLGRTPQDPAAPERPPGQPPMVLPVRPPAGQSQIPLIKWILFSTGFCAMAMEVVWTREFTPVLKTQVYSFASIVFTYLGATAFGSGWYRRQLRRQSPCPTPKLLALLVVATLLPAVICDPRWVNMDWLASLRVADTIKVLASIGPFCAILGYLTPKLIDEYAGGHPGLAGAAYALNVLGCILGPLFACYVLLPRMSEQAALMVLSLPFGGFFCLGWKSLPQGQRWFSGLGAGALAAFALFFSNNFQDLVARQSSRMEVRRDYAASVVSADPLGDKVLLVNGVGMTALTPITKFMVHLPLAFHQDPPQSALIICFGMGTTYRSALSWNVDTTAVELVPSVTEAFGFYHADAAKVRSNPRGHIVIDDGRRFLRRTREKFDVIVIDPPPPVETAGSSLLYSTEFYELAKQHLNPHGILQAWFPSGDPFTAQAVLRSIYNSFPHVRFFHSFEGWGIHMLASMDPIEVPSPEQLATRLPASAANDLLEWSDSRDLPAYLGRAISHEIPVEKNLNPDPAFQITDDNPSNEYFLLRQAGLL
jgi:spermidine synthase